MKKLLSIAAICMVILSACNNEADQKEETNVKGNGDTAAGGTPMSVMDSTTQVLPVDSGK